MLSLASAIGNCQSILDFRFWILDLKIKQIEPSKTRRLVKMDERSNQKR